MSQFQYNHSINNKQKIYIFLKTLDKLSIIISETSNPNFIFAVYFMLSEKSIIIITVLSPDVAATKKNYSEEKKKYSQYIMLINKRIKRINLRRNRVSN